MMNKNVIVAFVVAIVIFSLFAIYGLVNQDYLKNNVLTTTTTTKDIQTTKKISQTCSKTVDNVKILYLFNHSDDKINKVSITYSNKDNADEYNNFKNMLTTQIDGISNKHLYGTESDYRFTFDIVYIDNTVSIGNTNLEALGIIFNSDSSLTGYLAKLTENSYIC